MLKMPRVLMWLYPYPKKPLSKFLSLPNTLCMVLSWTIMSSRKENAEKRKEQRWDINEEIKKEMKEFQSILDIIGVNYKVL